MERNLDRRVEVLCPVHDRHLADHLRNVVLATLLRDVTRAHLLQANGSYIEAESLDSDQAAIDSQETLARVVRDRAPALAS